MIQRIQSLYLLLGALALGSVLLLSPWQTEAAATFSWFVPTFAGLVVLTSVSAVGAIFLYRARKRQRTVVVGVQTATVLTLLVLYGALFMADGGLNVRATGALDYGKIALLGLPVVSYGFFYFARRGIDHDIDLLEAERKGRLR